MIIRSKYLILQLDAEENENFNCIFEYCIKLNMKYSIKYFKKIKEAIRTAMQEESINRKAVLSCKITISEIIYYVNCANIDE